MSCEIKNKTGNPICSGSLKDLEDSVVIMDQYINSQELEVEDRLGEKRKTWAGIEKDAQDEIDSLEPKMEQLINDKIVGAGGIEIAQEWGYREDATLSQKFLSETFDEVRDFIESSRFIFVSSFGDTSTIDGATQALREAIAHRKSTGIGLVVIDRDMTMGDQDLVVTDFDNFTLVIPKGITLSITHLRFNIPSTGRGYDGGYKNWYIVGEGTIKGICDNSVFYIQAAHVINIGCKGITFENITGSHLYDLLGCKTVRFKDVKFVGSAKSLLNTSRHYIEAIQINAYSAAGMAYPETANPDHFDYLDTIDVQIDRCSFIPSYNHDGSINNYASRPFGNHSRTVANNARDIYIRNCKFMDVIPVNEGDGQNFLKDYVISIPSADNVNIINNEFITTFEEFRPRGFIYIVHNDKGRDSVGNNESDTIHRDLNVNIQHNRFLAMNANSDTSSALIRVNVYNQNSNYCFTLNENNNYIIADSESVSYLHVYARGSLNMNSSMSISKGVGRFAYIDYSGFNSSKECTIDFNNNTIKNSALQSSCIVTANTGSVSPYSSYINIQRCTFIACKALTRIGSSSLSFVGNTVSKSTPVDGNQLHEDGLIMGINNPTFNVSNNIIDYYSSSSNRFKGVIVKDGQAVNGVNNYINLIE